MPKKDEAKVEEREAERADRRPCTDGEVREAARRHIERNREALTELARW